MRWDVFGQFAITDIISKTNLFALSIHRLFFLRPSSRLSLSLTLRFSSLECMLQQQALGKTNQSLTTVVAEWRRDRRRPPPSLLPFLSALNTTVHCTWEIFCCNVNTAPSSASSAAASEVGRRRIIYSERAKEELWLLERAAKTQNSKATEDAWHDTQSERRSEGSLPFLLFSGSVSPVLFLVFLIPPLFLSP